MNITTTQVTQLTIFNASRAPGSGMLDPVRVIVESDSPTSGRITITCYGRAWTAYWGAMSTDLASFFCQCDAGYIHDNLVRGMSPTLLKTKKNDKAYLADIIVAVQSALRQQAELAS